MEGLGLTRFGDAYRGLRVLITGHTGFKGSWLALWLQTLGAEVAGIALAPESPLNHWQLLDLDIDSNLLDIRDRDALAACVRRLRPHVVFHLAAQALVQRSYREPAATFETNVCGTANLLDACRNVVDLGAVVVVTSDKCYANREWPWGYRETDRLGGHDPYSASKAAAEIVVDSYRRSFFSAESGPLVATARAGNVVGGGDWAEDRLVPDFVRAASAGRSLTIRSPNATRPWQHVLEPLAGYLLLGEGLLEGRRELAEAWNFGPPVEHNCPVAEAVEKLRSYWPELRWQRSADAHPHEATLLYLDSSKARQELGWRPRWDLTTTLQATAAWYQEHKRSGKAISRQQLEAYSTALATAA